MVSTPTTTIYESDLEGVESVLLGRRVVRVNASTGKAELDDGTVLTLAGNEGGCSCSSGDYFLTDLNVVDNVITKVELDEQPDSDDREGEGFYRIFVFADNQRINFATFEGSDGNGYYGTGYSIRVERPVVGA